MTKRLIFILSLAVLQGCSIIGYSRRGEKIPSEYVGETAIKMQNLERGVRNINNWLEDYNHKLDGY